MRVPIAYLLTLLAFCPYALHSIAILFTNANPMLTTATDTLQTFDKLVLAQGAKHTSIAQALLLGGRKGNTEEKGGN